jgi:16S rRNA C967 or C1407 C5-methylase (RsmB/RsmF family)
MAESGSAPDLGALNAGQRAIWASGDFAVVGTPLQIVAEVLCEAMDLRSGMRVLDVCAGHGNASLAAARRWSGASLSGAGNSGTGRCGGR